jgi:hypothetical protein
MSIPNVDTFEHDIAQEIKTREATITDIASASGDVGNLGGSRARTSNLLIILGAVFIVAVIGILVALFFLYGIGGTAPTTNTPTPVVAEQDNRLSEISPALHTALGDSVGKISKSEYGYAMQILSYGTVFSYMLKNETDYADQLAASVGSARDASTSTPLFSFTDVTLQNQNMRVGTSGSSTVVYAFVNTNTLLVSSSTEGVLTLRSAILSQ